MVVSERAQIFSGLAAEVAFAIFPLLVVLLVVFHAQHSVGLFASPEWSFGAAILFGQTLVKFVSGMLAGGHAEKGPVALAVSLLVVFGLGPSIGILIMILQAVDAKLDPANWLQAGQVILFSGATISYLLLGTIGEIWRRIERQSAN